MAEKELKHHWGVSSSPCTRQTKGKTMRIILKGAVIALSLAAATLGSAITANAAVGVSFDIGNVAVGYSDGYMGTDNQYHAWQHHADAARYQKAHKESYHGYRHDDPKHR
jgi:uncharacterized protein (DUF697 family)